MPPQHPSPSGHGSLPRPVHPRPLLRHSFTLKTVPSQLGLYQLIFRSTVPQGPFAGMNYIRASVGSVIWPKLFGTYELELNPGVEQLVRWQPDVIVNAGAAEGYFAVGMAFRCPQARIEAFELMAVGRQLVAKLATKNQVLDRVGIHEGLDPEQLRRFLEPATRPAIVLDVEGYELELLRPEINPVLTRSFILLENHVVDGQSTTDEIRRRFTATHRIHEVPILPRGQHHLPARVRWMATLGFWPGLTALLDEGRGDSPPWFVMEPIDGGGNGTGLPE